MRKLTGGWMYMSIFLSFMAASWAQGPDTLWTKTYGGSGNDEAFSIIRTSIGTFLLAGYTESFGAGGKDVYLLRLYTDGDDMWIKTYGGEGNDVAYSVMRASDGYYVAVGYTESFGNGGTDVYILKLEADGDTLWTRTYGSNSDDGAFSIIETSDGNYLIAGYTRSAGGENVYLLKITPDGDTLWTKNFGNPDNYEEARQVIETTNGDYLIVGRSYSPVDENWNLYYARTDANGDTLWTGLLGGEDDDGGYGIIETEDQDLVLLGFTSSIGNGGSDLYAVRIDADGVPQWSKTLGGPENEIGYAISQAICEGYVIAGVTSSYGSGGKDAYLLRINYFGDSIWAETYGGTQDDGIYSVTMTSYPGYIAAGYTESMGAGGKDVYILNFGYDDVSESSKPSGEGTTVHTTSSLFSQRIELLFSEVPGNRVKATLYDATGRLLRERHFDGNSKRTAIDGLGDLPTGVYFLEVSIQGGPSSSLRLLKIAK